MTHPYRAVYRSGLPPLFMMIGLALAASTVDSAHADDSHQCFFESIQATFKAESSTYRVAAVCKRYSPGGIFQESTSASMRWSSIGTYDPRTRIAREDISVNRYEYSGTVTTTLSCPSDPWLGPSLEPGMVRCANPTFNTSGGSDWISSWFLYLQEGFYSIVPFKKIGPLPNSTGFQYNRASLIAQRDAELKAEQEAIAATAEAARQKQNKRLNQAAKPAPAVVAPAIVLPTANALFMQNNVVPIKVLPPQGMTVTSFLVKLERRDSQGNWVIVTNLPISIAEATSPNGYTGWGAPGNGRNPAQMVSLPGSYRISAQVSSPRQTLWSTPVPFAVTSPSKAIQKAPKMFGQ
jgi:hypothetical protein